MIIGKGSQGRGNGQKNNITEFWETAAGEAVGSEAGSSQQDHTGSSRSAARDSADAGKQLRKGVTYSQVRRNEAGLAMRLDSEALLATPRYSQQDLTTASVGRGQEKEREESGVSVRLLGCLGKIYYLKSEFEFVVAFGTRRRTLSSHLPSSRSSATADWTNQQGVPRNSGSAPQSTPTTQQVKTRTGAGGAG